MLCLPVPPQAKPGLNFFAQHVNNQFSLPECAIGTSSTFTFDSVPAMLKTLFTYVLWLCFGIFGLHHFYLGRYTHGFLWSLTCGGYFVGWLRDFFHLKNYIHDSDTIDQPFVYSSKPSTSWFRWAGQVTFAYSMAIFAYNLTKLVELQLQDDIVLLMTPIYDGEVTFLVDTNLKSLLVFLSQYVPLLRNSVMMEGAILGVWLVGSITPQRMSGLRLHTVGLPLVALLSLGQDYFLFVMIVLTFAANYFAKQWKDGYGLKCDIRRKRDSSMKKSVKTISLLLVAVCIWIVYIYTLGSTVIITSDNGESCKLKDHPLVRDTAKLLKLVYDEVRANGWEQLWESLYYVADPQFVNASLKRIGLKKPVDLKTIRRQCRHLGATHHPDRYSTEAEKQLHAKEFANIRTHCDRLISIYSEQQNPETMDD